MTFCAGLCVTGQRELSRTVARASFWITQGAPGQAWLAVSFPLAIKRCTVAWEVPSALAASAKFISPRSARSPGRNKHPAIMVSDGGRRADKAVVGAPHRSSPQWVSSQHHCLPDFWPPSSRNRRGIADGLHRAIWGYSIFWSWRRRFVVTVVTPIESLREAENP